jgi:hypothetical protein
VAEDKLYFALVPVLDTSKPNFKSAGWRVVEAAERLNAVIKTIPNLGQEWTGHPVVRAPKSSPDDLLVTTVEWQWSQLPTARALTLLASEVLHHSRVALDYCAFHAVWLDRGSPSDKTKLPLVRDRSKWSDERRRSLPGINSTHLQWIEEVQPFANVEWSHRLVELSNRDKHRMAVEVVPTYRFRVNKAKRYADPLGDPTFCGFAVEDAKLDLRIAPAMATATTGRSNPDFPLEETLLTIVQGVAALVNRFLQEAGFEPVVILGESGKDQRADR